MHCHPQVAVIYMCTRLIVNVTQVYVPLYTLEVVDLDRVSHQIFCANFVVILHQSSVAKATLVIYVSGFLATFAVKYINKYLGRYVRYSIAFAYM